jgi:hypothetical protein
MPQQIAVRVCFFKKSASACTHAHNVVVVRAFQMADTKKRQRVDDSALTDTRRGLLRLPESVWLSVLVSFLDFGSVRMCGRVCRHLRASHSRAYQHVVEFDNRAFGTTAQAMAMLAKLGSTSWRPRSIILHQAEEWFASFNTATARTPAIAWLCDQQRPSVTSLEVHWRGRRDTQHQPELLKMVANLGPHLKQLRYFVTDAYGDPNRQSQQQQFTKLVCPESSAGANQRPVFGQLESLHVACRMVEPNVEQDAFFAALPALQTFLAPYDHVELQGPCMLRKMHVRTWPAPNVAGHSTQQYPALTHVRCGAVEFEPLAQLARPVAPQLRALWIDDIRGDHLHLLDGRWPDLRQLSLGLSGRVGPDYLLQLLPQWKQLESLRLHFVEGYKATLSARLVAQVLRKSTLQRLWVPRDTLEWIQVLDDEREPRSDLVCRDESEATF